MFRNMSRLRSLDSSDAAKNWVRKMSIRHQDQQYCPIGSYTTFALKFEGQCAPFSMLWFQKAVSLLDGRKPIWFRLQKSTCHTHAHTHILRPFGPLSGTIRVSRYQKGKTNMDLLEQETVSGSSKTSAMKICISPQTDNHASNPQLSFFTGRMPFVTPNKQCQSPPAIVNWNWPETNLLDCHIKQDTRIVHWHIDDWTGQKTS